MSRKPKIFLIIAGSLAGLIVILAISALIVVQTAWFRNLVRDRIVQEIQDATGGQVEISSFYFDWRQLRAEIRNLVIHGTEPRDGAPLLRVELIQVGLKIVSVLKRDIDIASLLVQKPQAYLIAYADGRTNVPEPKIKKKKSDKSGLETVLDLAVKRFDVTDGTLEFDSRKSSFNAKGENLRAQLFYEMLGPRYKGEVSVKPLRLQSGNNPALDLDVKLPISLEKDKIQLSDAKIDSSDSHLTLSGALENLTAPRVSLKLNARLGVEELSRALALSLPIDRRSAAGRTLDANVSVSSENNRVEISSARFGLGASNIEASGSLNDLSSLEGSLQFNARLAVGELGRMLKIAAQPDGTVRIGGKANFAGSDNYSLTANLDAREISFRQGATRLTGVNAVSRVEADPKKIELSGLKVAALGGSFTGSAGIRNMRQYRLDGMLHQLSIGTLAKSADSRTLPWDGIISGPVHAEGDLRASGTKGLKATARLAIVPSTRGIPLAGKLDVTFDGSRDILDLGQSYIALPASRLDLSGSLGKQINVRLVTRNLNDFLPILAMTSADAPKTLPVALRDGVISFEGTVVGNVDAPQVSGHLVATNFVVEDKQFDRFAADVKLANSGASLQNATLARDKLQAQFEASVGLRQWKPEPNQPVSASASMRNADVAALAALAGQKTIPVAGQLTASVKVAGTVGDPHGSLDIAITKGSAYEEPFDRLQARVLYSNKLVDVPFIQLAAGPARLDLKASFEHPPEDFKNGRIQFHVASNQIRLDQFQTVRKARPGLTGTVQMLADGVASVQQQSKGTPKVVPLSVNANLSARGIEINKKPVGDLTATAETKGKLLAFHIDSDFAKSMIRGQGQAQLDGDFPVSAELTFSQVSLSSLQDWMSSAGSTSRQNFDGFVEGKLTVNGPAAKPENLRASLEIPKIELGTAFPNADAAKLKRMTLQNEGPIVVTLDKSVVRIVSARIVGPSTDLKVSGTVALQQKNALDLNVNAGINLEVLHDFNTDMFTSGNVAVDVGIRGRLDQPLVNGRMELKNASFNMADLPNGLSKANGLIVFNGNNATIERLAAETGGGKLSATGFLGFGGGSLSYRLQATATEVRVRYPEGASTVANATINLTGTSQRSLLAGTVTILRTGFNPKSDIGSILSKSAAPVRTPSASTGPLAGMQLDIRIETSPDISFQTALAQDISAEANLRLRGTLANPALLGRITITQGELSFFGTKYTLNQGTISFYNPLKIEPVLNIDLETKVRGVDVTLTVTGPVDKMNLTHRSDPPLQFSEIVALLATGRAPTSDPTLAARQQTSQPQTFQQMGASALLGQAVANPVSGRLQRLFGVSKLKIDPSFSGAENTPQARLTLEQQVTKDITFTYITNLTRTNSQIVRVEWALSKQWSAVALREENGLFGIDFLYKKRFK